MERKLSTLALASLIAFGSFGTAGAVGDLHQVVPSMSVERVKEFLVAQRRTCQAANTCEDAVEMWCGGYSRADGDGDGIPCENVCRSLSEVEAIKNRIGC
jgi:hypothetical protein